MCRALLPSSSALGGETREARETGRKIRRQDTLKCEHADPGILFTPSIRSYFRVILLSIKNRQRNFDGAINMLCGCVLFSPASLSPPICISISCGLLSALNNKKGGPNLRAGYAANKVIIGFRLNLILLKNFSFRKNVK